MNLSRRQLLGAAAGAVAVGVLPAAGAEPIRSVSVWSCSAIKADGVPFWDWWIRYSVNGGEKQVMKCQTTKLEVELPGGVLLRSGCEPDSVGIVGTERPDDDPLHWGEPREFTATPLSLPAIKMGSYLDTSEPVQLPFLHWDESMIEETSRTM
jgi:hypothetical protein